MFVLQETLFSTETTWSPWRCGHGGDKEGGRSCVNTMSATSLSCSRGPARAAKRNMGTNVGPVGGREVLEARFRGTPLDGLRHKHCHWRVFRLAAAESWCWADSTGGQN